MSYVVNISVLAEFLFEKSQFKERIEKLFEDSVKSKLYASPITVSELIYVASRIYSMASVDEPNHEACNFVYWLLSNVGIKLVPLNLDISLMADEIRKRVRMALSHCIVIATAMSINANPPIQNPEK